MQRLLLILFFACGLTAALTVHGSNATAAGELSSANATARRGRHFEEFIQLTTPSKKTKRQIIKIPGGVSRVKLVQPPLSLRHNRAPQQFSRYPPNFRGAAAWRPPAANAPPFEPRKLRRTSRKPAVVEVSPEEFYTDDPPLDFDEDTLSPKKPNKRRSAAKTNRKRPKQNALGDFLATYEGGGRPSLGHDPAGSTIHMQQLPPPNPFPHPLPPDANHVPALKVKALPTTGRQAHSMFSQHYTTHNPHVATNFGLSAHPHAPSPAAPPGGPPPATHTLPSAAASDHVLTAVPPGGPAMHLVQPPQFGDVTASHPSHPSRLMSGHSEHQGETSSEKATIRDILDQDCPSHDAKGYCDSPPRYPMQQIKSMVKKCGELMDAMNTQPFEDPQEGRSFARRADERGGRNNKTVSVDLGLDSQPSSWSRSGSEGFAACSSDVELTEPGYAREVNSERWFVIVQHPDTTIQRVATDTCRSPGKPCGGLSEAKCLKVNGLSTKATRCLQRHTNQRLISWDPEAPEECPRMRVFRFPSACTCHFDLI